MLNVVTGEKDQAQAILIRGVKECIGPGRLTRELQLDKSFYGEDLSLSQRLWIEEAETIVVFNPFGLMWCLIFLIHFLSHYSFTLCLLLSFFGLSHWSLRCLFFILKSSPSQTGGRASPRGAFMRHVGGRNLEQCAGYFVFYLFFIYSNRSGSRA